jgi:hypothetical protein
MNKSINQSSHQQLIMMISFTVHKQNIHHQTRQKRDYQTRSIFVSLAKKRNQFFHEFLSLYRLFSLTVNVKLNVKK